jgi:hypothetical protein
MWNQDLGLPSLFCPSVDEMSLCSPSNHISTYHLVQLKIQASSKNEDRTCTFVLPILWCSQNDDHPDTKIFDQIWLYTKYESFFKKDSSIFLFTYWNLSYKSGYWGKILKSEKFGPFFFPWKMFDVTKKCIFWVKIWPKFPSKKTTRACWP